MHLSWLPLEQLPSVNVYNAFLLVGAAAIAVHLIYKKYEIWPSSVIPTLTLLVGTPYLASIFLVPCFSSFGAAHLAGFSVFYATLLASITVYRLAPWHPLAKYPGPTLAKLSKLWSVWLFFNRKRRERLLALHQIYGPYVRIGPNELSFVDVDLMPALLAPDMPRGPMWDSRRNPIAPTVLDSRSRTEHAQLRVPWTHALSIASVRDYQPAIVKRVSQLADRLEQFALAGETVNLVKYMSFFAFDFMGDMAFGGGFELMHDGDIKGLWSIMTKRIQQMTWQMYIPWSTRLLLKFPLSSKAILKFRNFSIDCATKRQQKGSTAKDLFYYLMLEDQEKPSKIPTVSEVAVNGEIAIIGGSDTTATTLSGAFYHLMANPEYYARLRKEVDETFPPGEPGPFDGSRLSQMKFLNAVINETLRLQPPVPTGLQRAPEKGSGGKWVGNHFLSENTAVNVAPYVYHHDPRYFSPLTDEFWPDRWLQDFERSEKSSAIGPVIHNVAAFIPFSAGHAICGGKGLAYAEMRMVVALLIQRFDMCFADGYDPNRWENEIQDVFVSKLGELPVVLTKRV